jgi:hypothetical protein
MRAPVLLTLRAATRSTVAVLIGAVLLGACGSGSGDDAKAAPATKPTTTTTTIPSATDLVTAACNGTLSAHDVSQITPAPMKELSGLVASRSQPGVLWAVNDSGDIARIYAVATDGTYLGSYVLTGVTATDWEDIAIGPGPKPGTDYLYVGDIGDNANGGTGVRPQIGVLRVPEPRIDRKQAAVDDQPLAGTETFPLTYPDRPRDIETLLVDPKSGEIVLVHKSWSGTGEAIVYKAQLTTPGVATPLLEVGKLALAPGEQVTSGDVAPAGDAIALRTYTQVLLFRRPPSATLAGALASPPCARPGPDEKQGESVTFSADAKSLYTVSEGEKPILHQFDVTG